MTFFYILLILICVYLEVSTKYNTDNLINKLALGCIIIGSVLNIASEQHVLANPNNLIGIGAFLHFVCDVMIIHKSQNRRAGD